MKKQIKHFLSKLKDMYLVSKNRYSLSTPKHLKKILSVEGSITLSECELLFNLSSQVSSGCIVEIGSYRGRSTVALALGSQQHRKVPVYAIEPHELFKGVLGREFGARDRKEFFKNCFRCNVCEIVRLVNLSSEVVTKGWSKQVELLWIDGDHRYKGCKRDFECWEPFIIKGGLIVFHDSRDPNLGPSKVIAEAISSRKFKQTSVIDSTTVLKKL